MYIEQGTLAGVILIVCAILGLFTYAAYEITKFKSEQLQSEAYRKGVNDGKAEAETATKKISIVPKQLQTFTANYTVEFDDNWGANDSLKTTLITEQFAEGIGMQILPFVEFETMYEPLSMKRKVHGRVKLLEPEYRGNIEDYIRGCSL